MNITPTGYRYIAMHIILVKLLFAHMAAIKDSPDFTPVLKQVMKQQFGQLWNIARSITVSYNRVCDAQQVDEATQTSEAMMWEAFELLFNSPDPITAIALLKAFNNGQVTITND